MTLWVDAQLPPQLCAWLHSAAGLESVHVRDLDLLGAEDAEIFEAAGSANVVVMTKDRDFVELLLRRGAPPRVLWVRLGNTPNENLQRVLTATLDTAMDLLARGESLVEITHQEGNVGDDAT